MVVEGKNGMRETVARTTDDKIRRKIPFKTVNERGEKTSHTIKHLEKLKEESELNLFNSEDFT